MTMQEYITCGERRAVTRRYAPKVRTGCSTCKIRRVKCDEARPHCHRCTGTGRKCDGYASLSPADATSPVNSLTISLSFDSSYDALENRTFEFFRLNTAPRVSGYFQDAVWERYVLQVSHSEPTIRHAVNALGALHEEKHLRKISRREGLGVSPVRTSFPVMQYSKALQGLQTMLKRGSVPMDLVLMCVLIFIHFEAMRESFVPALIHADNAIRLLHSSTTFEAQKVDQSLVRAMMRLDLQGSLYLDMRVPGLTFYTAATDSTLPTSFRDLTQARDFINTWTCRMFHFMRIDANNHKFREPGDLPLEVIAKSHELVNTFTTLEQLLWDFMYRPTVKLSGREQHGLAILRMRVKIDRMLSATCIYSEATMFDAYLDEFEKILTMCRYVMDSDDPDRRLFSVSLDEGLLHPLSFVAAQCRDGRIRRQALAQLEKLPNKEGIWHVETMIRTAQLRMQHEEALCCDKEIPSCGDIPEWRRIHSCSLDNSGLDVKLRVTAHLRTRPNGMDGEWCDSQEMISWDNPVPAEISKACESRGLGPSVQQRVTTLP